jgi:predicted  nucleic acid-binding Zn-ribbon protein
MPEPYKIGVMLDEAADRLEELEREVADLPERDRIKTVMTLDEIAAKLESGDYSAEMLVQHLIRHHNRLGRELAVWKHEAKRLEAELAKFDEQAISWWCEYQDLKAKARES